MADAATPQPALPESTTPQPAPSRPAHPHQAFHQRVARRFIVLTVLLLIAALAGVLATQFWICELFTHFTPLYVLLGVMCVVGLAMARAWRWFLLAFALLMWHAFPVARFLLQQDLPQAASKRTFTVFHFNAGAGHGEPQRIVSHLRRNAKSVDAVVVIEATHDFELALEELKEDFPYQVKHLEETPFGIALASKHPIDFGAISSIPAEQFPHIEATIKLPGRKTPLALYALHAPPPISGDFAAARNALLAHVAAQAAAQKDSTPVVVGDFNLTPWSPYYARFAEASGLKPARNARRFDHTWPVTFDNAHLGIAIDHSFAHPSLRLVKRNIGPDLGSDHLPVTVTFAY